MVLIRVYLYDRLLLYYENPQIVWGFSIALAMKNKTPFDIILLRLPEAIIFI